MYENLMVLAPILVYFFGVLSPGPANLAITQVALEVGRKSALMLSLGIVTGSLIWGLLTFFGLIQAIQTVPYATTILSVSGAICMFWLAYSNLRKFFYKSEKTRLDKDVKKKTNYFLHGLMIHLTNPKAFLVWTIILVSTFKTTEQSFSLSPHLILIFCTVIGLIVFSGYAMLFSHPRMSELYEKYSRYTHLCIGLIFIFVSIQILLQINI